MGLNFPAQLVLSVETDKIHLRLFTGYGEVIWCALSKTLVVTDKYS